MSLSSSPFGSYLKEVKITLDNGEVLTFDVGMIIEVVIDQPPEIEVDCSWSEPSPVVRVGSSLLPVTVSFMANKTMVSKLLASHPVNRGHRSKYVLKPPPEDGG